MEAWKGRPKIELHAHMGGCVRAETLSELLAERGLPPPPPPAATLSECFGIFRAVHSAVDTLAAVERIAFEAVSDFAADNVRYLELRTTPRPLPNSRASARDYLSVAFRGIAKATAAANGRIAVGVLISIDRARAVSDALESVHLAHECAAAGLPVVGVDLSGNPHQGNWDQLRPALDYARQQARLPVTAHVAETTAHEETAEILRWRPDRLGHAVFADSAARATILSERLPVEVCLTSNIFSHSISVPKEHPFAVPGADHPVVFCTDDPGVFSTTVSRELALAEASCGIPACELVAGMAAAIDFCFASESTKDALRAELLLSNVA